jgi:hypothetical protein
MCRLRTSAALTIGWLLASACASDEQAEGDAASATTAGIPSAPSVAPTAGGGPEGAAADVPLPSGAARPRADVANP